MVLKGQKEQIEHTTDKSGSLIDSTVVQPGKRGEDLVLTVDMELQQKVDQIAKEELQTAIEMYPEKNRFMKDALVVMMNPKTGEVLALSGPGYDRENKKYIDDSFNVLYAAHRPGSIVKGATLLSGYDAGVVKPKEIIYDHPIKIQGTPKKSSYRTLGKIDDLDALRLSSNVYMFNVAMRMGGEFNYQYNQKINFDPKAFQTIRNYFSEFGLGVKTGIDFPYEEDGYKGNDLLAGKLMDFAIGQFDTFTTLQLAQYVSTIANEGYRMKPQLVKEIHEPISSIDSLGPILKRYEPNVLNKIEMDQKYIDRVQEGFREVFQEVGGTGYSDFHDAAYKPAGKTGTAQNERYYQVEKDLNGDGKITEDEKVWKEEDTENLTLIGYAPYDDPEVAFAVVVPDTGIISYPHYQYQINKKIGRRILDAYFEIKKEREQQEVKKTTNINDIKKENNQ